MTVFDFRKGKNTWGHALHSTTFCEAVTISLIESLRDWWQGAVRYSVVIHCQQKPKIGDWIRWTSDLGERFARIYNVEHPASDVKDLFIVYLRLLPDGRIENGK